MEIIISNINKRVKTYSSVQFVSIYWNIRSFTVWNVNFLHWHNNHLLNWHFHFQLSALGRSWRSSAESAALSNWVYPPCSPALPTSWRDSQRWCTAPSRGKTAVIAGQLKPKWPSFSISVEIMLTVEKWKAAFCAGYSPLHPSECLVGVLMLLLSTEEILETIT